MGGWTLKIGARPLLGSRIRSEYVWVFLVAFAAILPNLIWIFLDKAAWPWDQAWYGKHSVELFFTLVYSPSKWFSAMLSVLGRQAPGIAWIGQFFVPVGLLIGSVDTGLLLSIVLAHAAALLLTSVAAWELSDRRFLIAVTAVAAMASAPLFIGLSHYYLVEMMQTAAVAWFALIMALAPRWGRLLTASQLVLSTSFAMLAKVSSPLYCIGPGLVALYYLVRSGRKDESESRVMVAATLAFGVLLGLATVAWYNRNLQAVVAHISMAASGNVAELYGKQEQFLLSMKYWLSALRADFFSPPTAILAAGTLLASIVVSVVTPQAQARRLLLAVWVATLELAAVLSVFSLNSNRDNRYLLPLLPYVVLILCWSIYRLDRRLVTYAVVGAFGLQWVYAHAQSFGMIDRAADPTWLNASVSDARNRTLLDSIVERTCTERTSGFYWNAVGVQLLWLNPPAVSYAAAKALAPRHALNCDFDAIGYYDNDEDRAWNQLVSKKIAYYIAVNSAVYQTPSTTVDMTLNQLNEPILKRVEGSGLFQLEPGVEGHEGILIFRRVDQIDHVANGRVLSDQGKHQQAIDELNKATVLEPSNVEAWANLALAYERQGDFQQAVSAGDRARTLDANHYYVNLGLARAFMQQKEWTSAIRRAEDATLNAPGLQQRVNALAIAAQASFQARDSMKGCSFLRRAADLQSGREILDEIARNGCGR